AINPKIIDDKFIIKHLNKRFIVNLGIPYFDRRWDSQNICSDDKLIEKLTVHSYNDRIENKTNNWYIQDTILFNFIKKQLERYKQIYKCTSNSLKPKADTETSFQQCGYYCC
ncbi:8090_t:CDS:1, partial [Gigaspora margarita]